VLILIGLMRVCVNDRRCVTEKALLAIAGADSKLQEAITTGTVTSKKSSTDGQDYELFSVGLSRHSRGHSIGYVKHTGCHQIMFCLVF
jgi:hypothetical protein